MIIAEMPREIVAIRLYVLSVVAGPFQAQLYPHLLILLPSPRSREEGLGVRGFALCFDWFFDREFND